MKAFLILLVLRFLVSSCPAQISDDFSDRSLSDNPFWFGDTSDFIINDQLQLQLNANQAGTSSIFLATDLDPHQLLWSLDCQLDFDPSATNLLNLYLALDSTDISKASGFVVQIGESGDQDRIRLYRLIQGERELLRSGISSFDTRPRFSIEIKKIENSWIISTLDPGTGILQPEIEYLDSAADLLMSGYFAISCIYSDSRKDLFIFDNLIISNQLESDQQPPAIENIEVSTPNQIIVQFSEPIESNSASNPSNFQIFPGPGLVISSMLLADPSLVQLNLGQTLIAGIDYTLEVRQIADLAGNITIDSANFKYLPSILLEPYDIIINEIFDDPTPVLGLPEAEYIELLVRKDGLNLGEVTLKIGDRSVALPDKYVSVGDYLVIHDADVVEKFIEIPGSIAITKLPALVNSGSTLTLIGKDGKTIDVVSYDDNWYRSTDKSEGGWSLELINPEHPCGLAENWTASTSLSGGTPGHQNSALDLTHLTSAAVLNVAPIDSLNLRLLLNKSYLADLVPAQFSMEPGRLITDIYLSGPSANELILRLDKPLQTGIKFELSLPTVRDCSGNSFSVDPVTILIPVKIEPGDLVINEILFDPLPGGEDFVELYNRSSKALLLSDLKIGNSGTSQVVSLSPPYLILPGMYITLSPDPINLQNTYEVSRADWLVQTALPSFSNGSGNVTIFTSEGAVPEVIDAFDYDDDMHHPLLREHEGVSLERLDPNSPSQERANWHSAAQSAGFATPTALNSQHFARMNLLNENWQVTPQIFSPDGDGFDDYVILYFDDIDPGTYAHVKIFDAGGRMVRYLANNQSLSTKGSIQWDGTTDSGSKSPIGIYTIYIQVFDLTGKVTELKETCVVAARLN